MIKVTAPDANFLPDYLDGKWWPMITLAITRGFQVVAKGDDAVLEFSQAKYLSLNAFLAAAGDGYTIENWPCWLSLDAAKYNDPVPEGIPDRLIINEDETTTVKTWAQWGSSEHTDLTDGTKGIPLVYNSTACTNVECAGLYGLAGYTLLDTASYIALLPDSSPL